MKKKMIDVKCLKKLECREVIGYCFNLKYISKIEVGVIKKN